MATSVVQQPTTTPTGRLEMRWVQVIEPDGRTHLECRWVDPTPHRTRSAA